ncbi:MAG TPA: hypothetical protein GX698_02410 [Acholeplasmataceae bacterium]|nr:hypothetical protein [Acholeplasmataceae bacterium]
MKRTTFIVRIVLFILTLSAFLGSAVFAWVAFVEKTQPIMLYSGGLTAEAKLFILEDPDYDGEDINNEYTQIVSAYHLTRVQPGQIFTFKLEVTNIGTIPAHLKVNLEIDATSNSNLLDVMHIAYTSPMNVNQSLSSMMLFESEYIDKSETYVFYFNIVITEFVGNSLKGDAVIIKHLEIVLDQIQNV